MSDSRSCALQDAVVTLQAVSGDHIIVVFVFVCAYVDVSSHKQHITFIHVQCIHIYYLYNFVYCLSEYCVSPAVISECITLTGMALCVKGTGGHEQ